MELKAAIEALKYMKEHSIEANVFTDSKYVKDGITLHIKKWKKNKWKKSDNKPVLNQDLWKELVDLNEQTKCEWNWVEAHVGNEYNEMVDKLAKSAVPK